MKGTEKQIKWAEDIIAEFRGSIECMSNNALRAAALNSRPTDNMGRVFEMADIDACEAYFEKFFAQATASLIIDNRYNLAQDSLERMCAVNYIQRNK